MNATLSPVARIADAGAVVGGSGTFANVWGNIAAPSAADADPIGPETYGNIAAPPDADPVGPETWGNIVEDQTSAGERVTAPTLR